MRRATHAFAVFAALLLLALPFFALAQDTEPTSDEHEQAGPVPVEGLDKLAELLQRVKRGPEAAEGGEEAAEDAPEPEPEPEDMYVDVEDDVDTPDTDEPVVDSEADDTSI